ncbi:MAG: hypothetical protein AB1630_05090 [bacterium]
MGLAILYKDGNNTRGNDSFISKDTGKYKTFPPRNFPISLKPFIGLKFMAVEK